MITLSQIIAILICSVIYVTVVIAISAIHGIVTIAIQEKCKMSTSKTFVVIFIVNVGIVAPVVGYLIDKIL